MVRRYMPLTAAPPLQIDIDTENASKEEVERRARRRLEQLVRGGGCE